MKKKLIVILVLASTIMMVPTMSTQASNRPIRCFVWAEFDTDTWQWNGYIVFPGDPPEMYTLIWYADPEARFVGHPGDLFPRHLEKFYEHWEILDGGTRLAYGYDRGIWSEDSYEYSMNGKVTEAYGVLEYLMGANWRCNGIAWIDLEGDFQCIGEVKLTAYG